MLTYISYNAAVFKIITVREYEIVPIDIYSDQYQRIHFNDSSRNWPLPGNIYLNLSNSQWSQSYAKPYNSEYGDLYLAIDQIAFDTTQQLGSFSVPYSLPGNITASRPVVSTTTADTSSSIRASPTPQGPMTGGELEYQSPGWVRYSPFSPPTANATLQTPTAPTHMRVVHGFTTKSGIPSRIQISLHFMLIVIAMNLCKLVIMLYVVFTDRSQYIVTLGDAAASFLRRPDPVTKGKCLLNNDTSPFVRRYAPVFDTLDVEAEYHPSRFPKNAWIPRPQRFNASIGVDKGIPAITA